jgi:Tfp pilus assembly protein PilN
MNISINVLPDKQKEKIREERKISFIMKLAFSFIVALLIINTMLYLAQMILGIEYQAAKESSTNYSQKKLGEEENLEDIFKEVNSQVSIFSKTMSGLPGWARVLARISELCPGGVRIEGISVDGMEMKISGFAKTRDDFLNFQENLKKEGFQSPVDVSNLVSSKDFNFELNLGISEDYLILK